MNFCLSLLSLSLSLSRFCQRAGAGLAGPRSVPNTCLQKKCGRWRGDDFKKQTHISCCANPRHRRVFAVCSKSAKDPRLLVPPLEFLLLNQIPVNRRRTKHRCTENIKTQVRVLCSGGKANAETSSDSAGGACLPMREAFTTALMRRVTTRRVWFETRRCFDSLRNVRMGCGRSNGNKVGPMTPPNERSGSHRAHDYASTGKQPAPLLAVPFGI